MSAGRVITAAGKGTYFKKDVAPLVAAVLVGCSVGVYTATHHLRGNPEVKISRSKRNQASWEIEDLKEEGAKWGESVASKYRHKDNSIGHLSMFQAMSPSYWAQRAAVAADPAHATMGGHARVLEEESK